MNQQTIQQSFFVEGKGLHTGLISKVTFLPAAVNFGIRIKRIDLPDQPEFEAVADYVSATERGTVLKKDNWQIGTIEHAMAALYAMGIDNCLITANAPEFPILDGSAQPYVEAILNAGIEVQNKECDVFVVRKKIEYINESNSTKITLLPDDEFSIDVHIGFNSPILSNQFAKLDNLNQFTTEIAAARTFCFVNEIEPLLQANLIKGGDLENAIVIYDRPLPQERINAIARLVNQPAHPSEKLGYLCNLHFDNEPARHKLLDVIGDLALVGKRIQGKVIANHPGHSSNTALAKVIRKELKKQEVQPPIYNDNQPPIYNINDIRKILPHRFPFLLVDKIISITDSTIVGVKNVTANEPFFEGHFPQEPIMPGVLLVEAMAQIGGIFVLHNKENFADYSTYFLKIDHVKFRKKVIPGDTIVFRLELQDSIRRSILTMKGYGFVGEKLATEAEFTAQIIQNKQHQK